MLRAFCTRGNPSGLLGVPVYDGVHFIKPLFHLYDQLHLVTGAFQVMIGPVDGKILVAVNMIHQEAGGQLYGDVDAALGHVVNLRRRKGAAGGPHEAAGEGLKIIHIDGYLGKVVSSSRAVLAAKRMASPKS